MLNISRYLTDSTFHIGQMHVQHVSPCEDFADTFVSKDRTRAFLVVSDGCSTGGQTDIGARFIARRLYAQAQQLFGSDQSCTDMTPHEISGRDLEFLALKPEDVFATALSCCVYQSGACAYVYGDGVVAFVGTDGSLRLERLEWDKNTPFYPVYATAVGRKSGLDRSFARIHEDNPHPFTQTTVTIRDGREVGRIITPYTLEQGVVGVRFRLEAKDLAITSAIALFSDGICQVGEQNGLVEPLDWVKAVQECLAFKNTAGGFAKRRVRRAIQQWHTQGLAPQDDLSASVVLIERDSEPATAIINEREEVRS